jgi:rhamnogalacturonan endolyase
LEKNEIKVGIENLDLKNVVWEAPRYNNLLWQIGESTRKASEFKFGQESRNYKWMTMIPNGLNYIIGKSRESEDWYYAQPKDSKWNINFELDKKFSDKVHLTVALAAATTYQIGISDSPVLIVKVNDIVVKKAQYENDTTVYRSAMASGRYHLEEIEFSGEILKCGENVVTFESIDGAFMYDTILLETDEAGTFFTNNQIIENYKTSDYINENVYLQLKLALDKVEAAENLEERKLAFENIENVIGTLEFNCDVKQVLKTNLNRMKNI